MWILISPHHHVLVSPSDPSRYLCIMSDEEMETEQQQAAVIGRLHELRKQRGFVKRSVTGLIKNLNRLEDDPDAPGIKEEARRLQGRLDNLDKDFRSAHCRVASLFNEDSEGMEKEHSHYWPDLYEFSMKVI